MNEEERIYSLITIRKGRSTTVALSEHDELVKCQQRLRDAYAEIARLKAVIGQLGG